MNIPQCSPLSSYLALRPELDSAAAAVLAAGNYILGDRVAAFEQAFAAFCGAAQAIGCANGTDALELILRGCGIGPGDRVLTVANTAVATAAAIVRCGAEPGFVELEESGYAISPAALELELQQRPARAVIVVHLFGLPADLPALRATAGRYGALLIEDCAQAHGARLHGVPVGSTSLAAGFSFYPTKNLGAFGDGGAVITSDEALATRVRALRQYGWQERYISALPGGINSRLDELQAALLLVQLPKLAAANARRRELAARYDAGLAGLPLQLPPVRPGAEPVYHQYVIATPRREELRRFLAARGIGTAVHDPQPIHLQPAFRTGVRLPRTEKLAGEVLSLPMFPALRDEEADAVIAAIREFPW